MMTHLTIATTVLFVLGPLVQSPPAEFDLKELQKTLVKIDEGLYASKIEVTNKQYAAFLSHLKRSEQEDDYAAAQIDSLRWTDKLHYNEPYVKHYHRHPAYADYPVVNISHEGATLYCKWLTEQYNAYDKRKFERVRFRLPSAEEWTMAAKGGEPGAVYPWAGDQLKTDKGLYRCNYRRGDADNMGVAGMINDNADVTAPAYSYWPNAFGLYNMSGNVAEMLASPVQSKGGSWLDAADAMMIDGTGRFAAYEGAGPAIGFRCFMDVEEE